MSDADKLVLGLSLCGIAVWMICIFASYPEIAAWCRNKTANTVVNRTLYVLGLAFSPAIIFAVVIHSIASGIWQGLQDFFAEFSRI